MQLRRFYAPPESFDDSTVRLNAQESRHLRDVLRLKIGDECRVFDGEGREFGCVVLDAVRSGTTLRVKHQIEPAAPESGVEIHLATGVYKNDKLDLVVQKCVELGVAHFSPIVTSRAEVRLSDAIKRTERWRKIAMEATKQCERARVMTIHEPSIFQDVLDGLSADAGLRLMFSEKDGHTISESADHKTITALVGPKGGWEDSEIEMAVERGFVPVKLGRRIMRAETAAITFAAILQHRFGDLN